MSATPESDVSEVFAQMRALDVSQVPVFEAGKVVGALTEGAILDLMMAGHPLGERRVKDVMGQAPMTVQPTASAAELLKVMRESGNNAVLVAQGDRFEIITPYDLLHAM